MGTAGQPNREGPQSTHCGQFPHDTGWTAVDPKPTPGAGTKRQISSRTNSDTWYPPAAAGVGPLSGRSAFALGMGPAAPLLPIPCSQLPAPVAGNRTPECVVRPKSAAIW